MKAIWKFPIPAHPGPFSLSLPLGAQPLDVQLQDEEPMLWALVETAAPTKPRKFVVVPTGAAFDPYGWRYVATLQTPPYVWHIFAREEA